jgi:hypothetical protein
VTSWPDCIEGLCWFELLTLPSLGDLGDSLAQVALAQLDLDPDLIALGDLLLRQDVGIGHRYRPGSSLLRLECDRPLDLVNTHDRTCKDGRGFTDENSRA